MAHSVANVACTVCGCVCDDLRVTVDGNRITKAEGACALAEPWLLGQNGSQPPVAQIEDRAVPLEEAIRRAAALLGSARYPLIYGMSRSTEGQRAAIALADRLGATIDTTASLGHAASVLAFQQVGLSTCTLGEVKNRADLVIFWGANPLVSHPRHWERYSVMPPGLFVPRGRADRFVVVADEGPTASSAAADLFLPIEPGRDFEALWTLRALLRGVPVTPTAAGAALPLLTNLAERMKSCKYGIVFFGPGLTVSSLGHRTVEALYRLVGDLNDYTRFYVRGMGDLAGADNVLAWQTGYPCGVNLGRGYPRYNPGEFSAQGSLERGEADACLLLGSEGLSHLSSGALSHLSRIPTIALDHSTAVTAFAPTIRFTTAICGIHRAGTAYRMDDVPMPLRAVLPSEYPSDAEVLAQIESVRRSSNISY